MWKCLCPPDHAASGSRRVLSRAITAASSFCAKRRGAGPGKAAACRNSHADPRNSGALTRHGSWRNHSTEDPPACHLKRRIDARAIRDRVEEAGLFSRCIGSTSAVTTTRCQTTLPECASSRSNSRSFESFSAVVMNRLSFQTTRRGMASPGWASSKHVLRRAPSRRGRSFGTDAIAVWAAPLGPVLAARESRKSQQERPARRRNAVEESGASVSGHKMSGEESSLAARVARAPDRSIARAWPVSDRLNSRIDPCQGCHAPTGVEMCRI